MRKTILIIFVFCVNPLLSQNKSDRGLPGIDFPKISSNYGLNPDNIHELNDPRGKKVFMNYPNFGYNYIYGVGKYIESSMPSIISTERVFDCWQPLQFVMNQIEELDKRDFKSFENMVLRILPELFSSHSQVFSYRMPFKLGFKKINFDFITSSTDSDRIAAFAHSPLKDDVRIVINIDNWEKINNLQRIWLIIHELGHEAFGMDHGENYLMYPLIPNDDLDWKYDGEENDWLAFGGSLREADFKQGAGWMPRRELGGLLKDNSGAYMLSRPSSKIKGIDSCKGCFKNIHSPIVNEFRKQSLVTAPDYSYFFDGIFGFFNYIVANSFPNKYVDSLGNEYTYRGLSSDPIFSYNEYSITTWLDNYKYSPPWLLDLIKKDPTLKLFSTMGVKVEDNIAGTPSDMIVQSTVYEFYGKNGYGKEPIKKWIKENGKQTCYYAPNCDNELSWISVNNGINYYEMLKRSKRMELLWEISNISSNYLKDDSPIECDFFRPFSPSNIDKIRNTKKSD